MDVVVRRLDQRDLTLLGQARDVFDFPVDQTLAAECLEDGRHHLIGALAEGELVGFASAVDYVHPDKPRQLWINEVSVASNWQGCGIGGRLIDETLALARSIGCREVWVLTEEDNAPANALYRSAGGAPSAAVLYGFSL